MLFYYPVLIQAAEKTYFYQTNVHKKEFKYLPGLIPGTKLGLPVT